ncbi:hypothetical protein BA6E_10638 [Bacteroidales bacterium 6E]|nr:hypothetical protein BA6E_10638 [Bacteroidales bacterium 6E]
MTITIHLKMALKQMNRTLNGQYSVNHFVARYDNPFLTKNSSKTSPSLG